MPDILALSNIIGPARLRTPEISVAVADDAPDAKAAALTRLTTIHDNLGVVAGILDGVDGRIKLRPPLPPIPPVESLQSLVRRGRRRLERERQGAARGQHDIKLAAVEKLKGVLEA